MLTLKILREQPEFVIERLAVKNFDAKDIVKNILEADAKRRAAQTSLDQVLAQQNSKAKEIGMLMKKGEKEAAEAIKNEVARVPSELLRRNFTFSVLINLIVPPQSTTSSPSLLLAEKSYFV